tara:strand:+ start:471 stop:920 length:450 start_codon:yes stop_codon:yes gene_type:complete
MNFLLALGALLLSASTAVANDLLYLRCKKSDDIVITNSVTSEIIEKRTKDDSSILEIDLTKKTLVDARARFPLVFTIQNKTIIATYKVDNDELKSTDIFKLNLMPPYLISSKGTAIVKTMNRSLAFRGEGSCEEVDASVFETVMKESES